IDVGGGSTELTLYSFGEKVLQESFDIGTIRLMSGKVREEMWDEVKRSVKIAVKGHKPLKVVGSGGNINKIFSMSKKKDGKSLELDLLKEYYKELSSISTEDRIAVFNLREDRADVIVPALQIYINAMRWAGSEEIYVPKIGLADGLIHHLWEELKEKA
ncbi:MAG: exopolyphosphatase, partial [Ferruginibacter sp.]|nr:exopolyphosphatase [Ferruginibacter sp.]